MSGVRIGDVYSGAGVDTPRYRVKRFDSPGYAALDSDSGQELGLVVSTQELTSDHRWALIERGTGEEEPFARPDWVKCALTGRRVHVVPADNPSAKPVRTETLDQRTWCGRLAPEHEWTFMDASHAALNAVNGGRLVVCPECAVAIARALWTLLPDGNKPAIPDPTSVLECQHDAPRVRLEAAYDAVPDLRYSGISLVDEGSLVARVVWCSKCGALGTTSNGAPLTWRLRGRQ